MRHALPLLPLLCCLAGQGRGVLATEAVQPGTLLLVAPPLSVLYCEEGTTPENEDLAEHMLQVCCAAPCTCTHAVCTIIMIAVQ